MHYSKTFPKQSAFGYSRQSIPSFSITKKLLKFILFIVLSFVALNLINAQSALSYIPDTDSICSICEEEVFVQEKDAFSFCLKESAFAAVIFMDKNGKVLRTIRDEFDEGINTVSLSEFKGQGVLFYTLEMRGYSKTRSVNLL